MASLNGNTPSVSLVALFAMLFSAMVSAGTPLYKDSNGNLRPEIIVPALIYMAIGLVLCFFGRRFFRGVLVVVGFYLGALLAFVALTKLEPQDGSWGDKRDNIYLGTCIGAGVLLGILSGLLWKLGLFGVGALGGFFASAYLMAFANQLLIPDQLGRDIFIACVCVVCGVIALFLEHHVVIISTAIIGSYSLFYGLDSFIGTGFTTSMQAVLRTKDVQQYNIEDKGLYGMLVGMLAVCVVGIVVQYTVTAKHRANTKHASTSAA